MLPSLRDVLDLPAVRRGDPQVRAAAGHLDRRVRWVHVSEVSDIASLLEGGELILTTGIALPESAAGARPLRRASSARPASPRWPSSSAAATATRCRPNSSPRPSAAGCR